MQPCTINGVTIGGGAPVKIMGVINCSPESFFPGSYRSARDVRPEALEMTANGADIIDIGARSTSPQAPVISSSVEGDRMVSALSELEGYGLTLSVDTMKPDVLEKCLRYGIHAINDISGLTDPDYARLAADSGLPLILMASRSGPGDAVSLADTVEVLDLVVARCESFGIEDYILDPGIGLWTPARSTDLDWELCRNFSRFSSFERPLLAAISRKTFIGDLLLGKPPGERLSGSIALTIFLLQKGADIVRCHDVAETADAVRVFEKMERGR